MMFVVTECRREVLDQVDDFFIFFKPKHIQIEEKDSNKPFGPTDLTVAYIIVDYQFFH
jgi:hypothetical protein